MTGLLVNADPLANNPVSTGPLFVELWPQTIARNSLIALFAIVDLWPQTIAGQPTLSRAQFAPGPPPWGDTYPDPSLHIPRRPERSLRSEANRRGDGRSFLVRELIVWVLAHRLVSSSSSGFSASSSELLIVWA